METEAIENMELYVPPVDRRTLLPVWIKIFTWLFMIMGAVIPIGLVSALLGFEFNLMFYGLKTNQPFSLMGGFLMLLIFYKGVTAFFLWTRKNVAIVLGEIDAVIGMGICMFMMLVFPFINDESGFHFYIRGELFLLVPYYIKLRQIKQAWKYGMPNL